MGPSKINQDEKFPDFGKDKPNTYPFLDSSKERGSRIYRAARGATDKPASEDNVTYRNRRATKLPSIKETDEDIAEEDKERLHSHPFISGSRMGRQIRRGRPSRDNISDIEPGEKEEKILEPTDSSALLAAKKAANEKMDKATQELFKAKGVDGTLFAITNEHPDKALEVGIASKSDKGSIREENEDAINHIDWDSGLIAVAADGHGDHSNYSHAAASKLPIQVKEKLDQGMAITEAFETTIKDIHNDMRMKRMPGGTCLVATFLDKKEHVLNIATLGDCEAVIIREGKAVPISLVRDWDSPEDKKRTENSGYNTSFNRSEKKTRLVLGKNTINFSRSIGDTEFGKLVSQEPEVTRVNVKPGDKVILATDGLWDYVDYQEASNAIKDAADPFQALIDLAFKKESQDNVSVSVITVK